MRDKHRAKTLLVALVVTIGVALAFLTPSVSFAEPDQADGSVATTETPASTEQPAEGESTDATAEKKDEEGQTGDAQATEPAPDDADQPSEPVDNGDEKAADSDSEGTADGNALTAKPTKNNAPLLGASASYSDITMRVVKVNGKAVDPVITYLGRRCCPRGRRLREAWHGW